MRYFVINLDKDIERFKTLDSKMKKLNINIERIQGVDVSKMSPLELLSKTNTFMYEYGPNSMNGIFLAHMSVWKKIYLEKIEYAIILEDDVDVDDNITEIVNQILDRKYNFDMFLLSYVTGCKDPEKYNLMDIFSKFLLPETQTFKNIDDICIKPEFFSGMQMYMLSYKGATKLLKEYKEACGHVDLVISGNNKIKKLALKNKVCKHNGEKTSNNVSKSKYILDKIFLSNYYLYDINMEWGLNMPFFKIYNKNITSRFITALLISVIIISIYLYKKNYSYKNTFIYLIVLFFIFML